MSNQLELLGFNPWFRAQLAPSEGLRPARVTQVHREAYAISEGIADVPAELTGRLQFTASSTMDIPTVGDWVAAQFLDNDSFAVIHSIAPRKTLLKRKTSGREADVQLIGANIDIALIMQSLDEDFSVNRMERYMTAAYDGGIRPVVVLTKSDLLTPDEVDAKVSEASLVAEAIAISNMTEDGIQALRGILKAGMTFCLLGSSGVGKTTLLNRLMGQEAYATSDVRDSDHKGRHTTTSRQMTVIEGGAILIDTPGMREFAVMSASSGLSQAFPQIEELSHQCRFGDCTHTSEKGCAVLAALADGELDQKRYDNFMRLQRESEHHRRSYQERRKKDKEFGKMVKSVMKDHRKK